MHSIEGQAAVVAEVQEILSEFESREMHIAGIPVVERHFPEVGEADMTYLALMFVVIGATLFVIYRKVSGVLLPLLVVMGSILAMNGLVWLNGDLVNNLTAMTPLIMTAVGVADGVHLVTSYFILRPAYRSREELIIQVLRKNALPVFLTTLTTVVAFLSLTVSPIVPIVELGYTAAIGTVAAYVLSMTIVPAGLSLLSLPKTRKEQNAARGVVQNYWTDSLASFVERKRANILVGAGFFLAVSAFGLSRLQVESDMRLMFPATDQVVLDQNWIEDHLGGVGDLDLVFYGRESALDDIELSKMRRRSEALRIEQLQSASRFNDNLAELEGLVPKVGTSCRVWYP